MRFLRKPPFADSCYFLSNRSLLFHRFYDSGFRNKWTGLWSGERKLLEYFAVSVGGEWLSPENIEKTEYTFSSCIHTYRTSKGRVTETLFIPHGTDDLMIEISSSSTMKLEVKLGVNIRMSNENETSRKYEVVHGSRTVNISNVLGSVSVNVSEDIDFQRKDSYEVHEPSGEKQSYFFPGTLRISGKNVVISIGSGAFGTEKFSSLLEEKKEAYDDIVRGKIKSSSPRLAESFRSCILSMEMLKGRDGYYAGFPWFRQYWGRDTFWSTDAAIRLGDSEHVKRTLMFFSEKSRDGCIPNFVSESMGNSFNSIDATLLWGISIDRLLKATGDLDFARTVYPKLEESFRYIMSRREGAFISHDTENSETWMDTQRRRKHAVEVQALFYLFLQSMEHVSRVLGRNENAGEAHEAMKLLREIFDDEFFMGSFYADTKDSHGLVRKKTANAAVAIMTGLGKKCAPVMKTLSSDTFSSLKGVRTVSSDEHVYNPSGYHNGSTWSLTTLWAAAAQFRCGRSDDAWKNISLMMDDIRTDSIGSIGECWDSETGKLLGCPMQLWGEAMFISILDEFMLGIEIDALKNKVTVSPSLPSAVKEVTRSVFIGGKSVSIHIRKSGKGYNITCDGSDVKLIKK